MDLVRNGLFLDPDLRNIMSHQATWHLGVSLTSHSSLCIASVVSEW